MPRRANPNFGRDSVSCAASFNTCALILLLFAVISNYWSWGFANSVLLKSSDSSISVSTGAWVAGQAWSTFAVPCNCNPICNACTVVTNPVMWNDVDASLACAPNSTVFQMWSGPLNLCTFPSGFDVPAPSAPFNELYVPPVTGNIYPRAPAGTKFNVPSQISGMQAVTIIATLTCFFAAIIGCADAGSEPRNTKVAISAATCTFLAWLFSLTAVSLWAWVPYVSRMQSTPPQIYMPIWVSSDGGNMTAIPVRSVWLGPAWGTMLTSFFILFFTMIVHCASLRDDREGGDMYASYSSYSRKEPVPAAAQPVPTAAQPVPVAAQPVPPAMTGNSAIATV